MSHDLFLALLGFAFVASATPGPNNLMVLASGTNFGLARSVPHLAGISLGFALMIALVGLGLAGVLAAMPRLRTAMAVVSAGYLVWLAWRIARAQAPGDGPATGRERGRPLTFLQAAAFQWVNPKGWAMALTAVSLYAAGGLSGTLVVAAVFAVVSVPSNLLWLMMGVRMRRWLTSPARLRAFNRTMAILLVVSAWPAVAPLLRPAG